MAALRLDAGAELQLDEATLGQLADLVADRLEDRGVSEVEGWLGVKEAAAYLSCPVSRIYDLVRMYKNDPETGLQHRKDGSRVVTRAEWLDSALERP
jgi:hypothetical protein